jgi:hypothetical protein
MPVRISSDLQLPDDAITQVFGFLAQRGAGKTYSAGKLVEGLLTLHAQCIVIDPIGNWWGLQRSADGKSAGFAIPVFGDADSNVVDVVIAQDQGEHVGRLLIEKNLSAIIDVSRFNKAERKRFVTALVESLYNHAKRNPAPRMIVFEEAQVFAPQRVQAGEEKMLGAVEDLVRLGRNIGFGATLISQRPQSINKEVLNQVECLFVGHINASQERKAIEAWVADHKADKEWTRQLPGLARGQMIVWSPQWLKVMKQVQISKKITYDASATPVFGKTVLATKKLDSIDAPALQAALAELAPKKPNSKDGAGATSAELGPLQAQLVKAQMENARLTKALEEGSTKQIALERWKISQTLRQVVLELEAVAERTNIAIAKLEHFTKLAKQPSAPELPRPPRVPMIDRPTEPPPAPAKNFFLNERQEPPNDSSLPSSAVAMLKQLVRVHPVVMSKAQLAHTVGLKTTGGHWNKIWKALQDGYLSEGAESGYYTASEKTLTLFKVDGQKPPPTFHERVDFWREKIAPVEARILNEVIAAQPNAISRELIAMRLGLKGSGGFFNGAINTLVRNNLILRQKGAYIVHPWLRG